MVCVQVNFSRRRNTDPTDSTVQTGRSIISGWGRATKSASDCTNASTVREVQEIVTASTARGVVARGFGRAYGDSAQNAGGIAVRLDGASKIGGITADGLITVGAGVKLEDLFVSSVPCGWAPPVSPGTRQVSIGGAIAADVHGKDHHSRGSFANHVESLRLVDGTGATRELDASKNPDEFWATCGGMGLTGVITDATIRLRSVEGPGIMARDRRFDSLDDAMKAMCESDLRHRYSVAWVDTRKRGMSWRAIVSDGDDATGSSGELTAPQSQNVPAADLLPRVVSALTVDLFNRAWFNHASSDSGWYEVDCFTYFHPLDRVANWNRLFGPRGFLQYQFVVPDDQSAVIFQVLEMLDFLSSGASMAVLKRFGEGNSGLLSFPRSGWTLAVDYPVGVRGLAQVLDMCDDLVHDAGGRLYLAKDSRAQPEAIARGYPSLARWQQIRQAMDPENRFVSDQARRLRLV